MDELIDIYDENQNFIKTEMKSVAHNKGYWHKSVQAYLINDNNEIILQKRSSTKDFYPNVWDISFAGHVGAGEDTKISVVRECKEELGIDLLEEDISYLFTQTEKLQWGDIKSNEFVDVFLCKKNWGKISLQAEEVAEVKIVALKDFIKMLEQKESSLFPHYDVYGKILPILKRFI